MNIFKRKKTPAVKMVGAGPWSAEFARAFGLDPSLSHSITLHVSPDAVVEASVKLYVDENNTDIVDTIKKHVWTDESPPDSCEWCDNDEIAWVTNARGESSICFCKDHAENAISIISEYPYQPKEQS